MYGSTEGSTGRAKAGNPCGVRVFRRNSQSNTVSKALVVHRSSPRDNQLIFTSLVRMGEVVFFPLGNCGSSRHSRCGCSGKQSTGLFADRRNSSRRDNNLLFINLVRLGGVVFAVRRCAVLRQGLYPRDGKLRDPIGQRRTRQKFVGDAFACQKRFSESLISV